MEALEDLLSDTDCEGHLNFRPSGQFSFAAIRRQLENEGVEEEELEELEDDIDDIDEMDEQELDEQEALEGFGNAHLTRGLWDISALGLGAKHDYTIEPHDEDDEESSCKGQQIPSAVSEAPTALPDDAISSRAPTKRPSLKEEVEEFQDVEGDDVDFLPASNRDAEFAKDLWVIPSLRMGVKQGTPPEDLVDEDEGGLLDGNSVLLPSGKGQIPAASEAPAVVPETPETPETPEDGNAKSGASKRPFLKKGSRAKSTLPGNTGPLAVKRQPASTSPAAPTQAVASAPKREPRKPFRPEFHVADAMPAPAREHDFSFQAQATSQKTGSVASPLDDKDFNDSLPWDCRGLDHVDDMHDVHLQVDDEEEDEGEPPTSDIVRSYFHKAPSSGPSSAQKQNARSPHWEGGNAFTTLYGRTSPSDGSLSGAASRSEGRKGSKSEPPEQAEAAEAKARLQALDEELKKYEKENETLKKLQAHAKQAERDIAREREKLWKEVEAERTALHAEFDVERAALRKERKRLAEVAERQRQQLREEREAVEERQRLSDKAEQLEEEMREKEKRWQRTVDRLQRQVTEFTRKNAELQDEVQRLNQQAAQTQQASWLKEVAAAKKGISARTRRAGSLGPTSPSSGPPSGPGPSGPGHSTSARQLAGRDSRADAAPVSTPVENEKRSSSVTPKSQLPVVQVAAAPNGETDVRETRKLDGRIERIFADGRREVEFSNGLKKVMWTDGQTSVMFQNGDLKEIQQDGVVVYHYRATGAVQTTLTDGTELYQFSDGQTERHSLDGSKEIRFPNGTTKKIFSDGSEEVCFADGTVKKTLPPK